MRASPSFISTRPYQRVVRRVARSLAFRNEEGHVVLYKGSQVISIARISPLATESLTENFVKSILVKEGHQPEIVDARHGYRPTGITLGDRGQKESAKPLKQAAVRVAFKTESDALAAKRFLEQCGEFECKITLCRAPLQTQSIVSDLRMDSYSFIIIFLSPISLIIYFVFVLGIVVVALAVVEVSLQFLLKCLSSAPPMVYRTHHPRIHRQWQLATCSEWILRTVSATFFRRSTQGGCSQSPPTGG
jgi:hypothetical protein